MARRPRSRGQGSRTDPFLSYLLFAAVGVGTWRVPRPWRMTVLWLVLLVAFLLYAEVRPAKSGFSLRNVGWGALVGTVVSLPLLILLRTYLYRFVVQLFDTVDEHLLFHQLVILAAPVEELYLRGFVQRERGIGFSVLLSAGAALICFVPGLKIPFLAVVAITATYILLGFVHAYLYARHGLTTAISSHVTFNLLALVAPAFIEALIAL